MSKVQSPMSDADARQSDIQVKPDSWTLDVGLRVIDLRKSFLSPTGERLDVLRGVSFSASAGETVAIMGASAAGKSTLLQLIAGLETPDHGRIVLGSFDVDRASPASLAAFRTRKVGFVFQFHYLLSDLSAVENVALPLLMSRIGRREAIRRAAEALESTGLGSRITHRPTHLSGGEQQRVAVCRALITQPSIVLADEPTGNLDESFVEEIGKTLHSYARIRQAIVVIATHDDRLARICDRALVLSSGKLCAT